MKETTRPRLALLTACIAITAAVALLASATAFALPPGWGYELLSPADTAGQDIAQPFASGGDEHAWVYATTPASAVS